MILHIEDVDHGHTRETHCGRFGVSRPAYPGDGRHEGRREGRSDRFLRGGGTVIVTARSEPAEMTGRHFIRADVSTAEGATTVIRELLERCPAVTDAEAIATRPSRITKVP